VTTSATSLLTTAVSSCAATCTASSLTVLGVGTTTTCCQTDLCNSSTIMNASKTMMALVLVLAMSIFRLLKD